VVKWPKVIKQEPEAKLKELKERRKKQKKKERVSRENSPLYT